MEDLREVLEDASRNVCDVLQEMEKDRHEVLLGDGRAEDPRTLVHGKRKTPTHLPTHVRDHLVMHGFQLAVPLVGANRLEHGREIVRAIIGRLVINL